MAPSVDSLYGKGKELVLYPYSPAEPHGSGQYIDNPLPDDLPPGWIRGFNPTRKVPHNRRAIIKIAKRLSGGHHRRAQIFACTVRIAPSQKPKGATIPSDLKQLVAKFFDPMFYGDDCGAPFDTPQQQADGNLSREAGAYKYLYERNMTGGMQLVPQYYGSWAIKFNVGKNDDESTKFRCVGLVLMEYIPGVSISDLCVRDDHSEYLVLEHDRLKTGGAGHAPKYIPLDLDLRKRIMRMTIRGVVQHLHLGIEHFVISPENLFVALNDGPLGNLTPRAVMLDYTLTQVWCKTMYAKDPNEGPKHCLQLLPHPVHPLERFSAEGLEEFIGWYPLAPNKWSATEQAYCGPEVDNEGEFTKWLIDEFGPLVEGENDKGECYSTFATLYEIERQLEEEEEGEKMAQLAITVAQSASQTPGPGQWVKPTARDVDRQFMARQPDTRLSVMRPLFNPEDILGVSRFHTEPGYGNEDIPMASRMEQAPFMPQSPEAPFEISIDMGQSPGATTPMGSSSLSPEKGRGGTKPDLPSDLSGSRFIPVDDEKDDQRENEARDVSSPLFGDELEFKWTNESGEVIEVDDADWEDTSVDDDAQGGDAQIDEDDIYDP